MLLFGSGDSPVAEPLNRFSNGLLKTDQADDREDESSGAAIILG
jgi:hypothetical protein